MAKRTVQRHMRGARRGPPSGQRWATFIANHRHETWACDFLQVCDIWFRPIFAFFMIELGSRKVVQVGVTRRPWPPWVAQQLRNATPFGVGPRFLIRDRDDNYKCGFDQVASSIGTRILKTPVHAPKANGVCERFLGTVRRECIDHVLVLDEQQLMDVLVEYCAYYNDARPHQAIGHFVPAGESGARGECGASTAVVVGRAVLNGLHHDYRRVA